MSERAPLLELAGIEKSFGAVTVLSGVDVSLAPGEVFAVLGENGAGKSTLMRILLGVERADRGEMRLAGKTYRPGGPADARAAGVVMVPQERTLCGHLDVVENIVLGVEPTRAGVVDFTAARATASRALGLVAGDATRIALDARVASLGVADQQLVEIARALARAGEERKILVLDEPTSSLGHDDALRLFARIAALKEEGLAIVLVTHFLADVRAHADRFVVLRDGKVALEGDAKTTPSEAIVRAMLGRELEQARVERKEVAAEKGDALLDVTRLRGKTKPSDASFVLRRGEIFGIAGLVGSGRTELLRMLAGLDVIASGKVDTKAKGGVGLLSEDRAGEGLMLARSIAENVTLSPRGPLFVKPSETEAEGAKWIAHLAIRARDADQAAGELSGGNQQKVQIARLLREDYEILLVDEPTRGIDVASKAQVLELLRDLAKRGKGIVLVSSQLEELVATCDRIAVLKRGVLGPARASAEWDTEKLLLEAAS